MSKLPKEHRFIDLSDYGRPIAIVIATSLKNTAVTPVHITLAFTVFGLIAIMCMLQGYYWAAAFFYIFKSILDAADGELARIKHTPSYTGRYLDSIADIILNFLIFSGLYFLTETSVIFALLAFIGLQLQGTLYNYYYVILRNKFDGDKTSRIIENKTPVAMAGEKQKNVDVLFRIYRILYGKFDEFIFMLDPKASKTNSFPNWFMTAVSTFGLGFQLLIISVMLVLGWKEFIIPFFIFYSLFIFVFIGVRKIWLD
ncbi:CDP-alcohol phosphatidyltransferase family protein [Lutimonas vermicola]|uniref:CDP-alcohol phosphatidyltransferase family protein n=1 Tax=Lutimonas vermicola TaxID=414288 RepID=A0ABU9L0Q5_9FLAO